MNIWAFISLAVSVIFVYFGLKVFYRNNNVLNHLFGYFSIFGAFLAYSESQLMITHNINEAIF